MENANCVAGKRTYYVTNNDKLTLSSQWSVEKADCIAGKSTYYVTNNDNQQCAQYTTLTLDPRVTTGDYYAPQTRKPGTNP